MMVEAPDSSAQPESPPPPPPHRRRIDPAARELVFPVTLCCSVLGFGAGVLHNINTGYPLGRSVFRSTLNSALLSFTFLGLSGSLSERTPLHSTSLLNNALAGAVTFGATAGVMETALGRHPDAASALRAVARAGGAGVLVGAGWWAVRSTWRWWGDRAQRKLITAAAAQDETQHAVALDPEGAAPVADGSGASPPSTWLPAWSPVRLATEAEIERDRKEKERRRQQANAAARDTPHR